MKTLEDVFFEDFCDLVIDFRRKSPEFETSEIGEIVTRFLSEVFVLKIDQMGLEIRKKPAKSKRR
jgi:hypothetical protein